ncbi:hypothetical protein D9758_015393 [Tetrapyrgos nigripes]|uniref:Uncharacterized protein n=1 Tax=Tetrapyrgos nigripes TaxID=182062 RepID=A0A8H5CJJ5_9AGAR|nr:hypothetical protein D9758_015393 [Tetrapyrgos nigripes]
MADLIRTAKSGSDWTRNELQAYNIQLQREHPLAFFGVQALPEPNVDAELIQTIDAPAMHRDENAELITLLDLAMAHRSGECAVDDFAVQLFRTMGYVRRERVARTRKDLVLQICGELRQAKTDVCIVDRSNNDIILLVQEDKRVEDGENVIAEAQLVAEAIAAFAENNKNRETNGLEPLAEKVLSFFPLALLDLAFTL